MRVIRINSGEERIEVPKGIFVNGYIIKATVCPPRKSMVLLNSRANTPTTPTTKEN